MLLDSKYKLILGSKSPRRQELVKHITTNIEIRLQDVDETYSDDHPKEHVPSYLAELKAQALKHTLAENEILLTSDTIVLLNGEILGKPSDKEDAFKMLKKISGKKHTVLSACHLTSLNHDVTFTVATDVYFHPLTDEQIWYYLNHFNPLDKAGSYGIQDWIGVIGVQKIDGCFYNVMGLPVSELHLQLQKFIQLP